MLTRSRRGTSIDARRAGEALGFAGIDPRHWFSRAVVLAVSVADDGCYLDVRLVPDGLEETARFGAGGKSHGIYWPVAVNDEVLVGFPGGDPALGLVVVGRPWSEEQLVPGDAVTHPADVAVVAPEGSTVRVAVTGGGDVVIDPRGSGKVLLGGEDGTSPVARVGDDVEIDDATLEAWLTAKGYVPAGLPVPSLPVTGSITSGASKTEAK